MKPSFDSIRSSHPQRASYRPSPLGNTAEPSPIAPNNGSSTSFSALLARQVGVLTREYPERAHASKMRMCGATTSVYDDFVPEDAKAKPKEDPLKRVREGVDCCPLRRRRASRQDGRLRRGERARRRARGAQRSSGARSCLTSSTSA